MHGISPFSPNIKGKKKSDSIERKKRKEREGIKEEEPSVERLMPEATLSSTETAAEGQEAREVKCDAVREE